MFWFGGYVLHRDYQRLLKHHHRPILFQFDGYGQRARTVLAEDKHYTRLLGGHQ